MRQYRPKRCSEAVITAVQHCTSREDTSAALPSEVTRRTLQYREALRTGDASLTERRLFRADSVFGAFKAGCLYGMGRLCWMYCCAGV